MKTVLVVEDTDDLRELFVEALEQDGYSALGAENGEKALELLQGMKQLLRAPGIRDEDRL